eukprot:267527_1
MHHVLLIIFTHFIKHILGVWQVSNQELSRWNKRMAGGIYDDTIYLIGGAVIPKGVRAYQWTTETFLIDHNPLDTNIEGYGQYYTQHQHIVYMIVPQADYIATYNMQTNEFISNLVQIPISVSKFACLASQNQTLYVVGGADADENALNQLQILSVSTLQWTTDAPVMNEARGQLSCIVTNNYLWAFGGDFEDTFHITNERIHIPDIMQNSWNYVDEFLTDLAITRCISWNNIIYIIGGWSWNNDYHDTVYKMDVFNGSIISVDHLPFVSFESTPIIANAVLYVFGGLDDNGSGINNVLYLNLPTIHPSADSTRSPSKQPSHMPTSFPTVPTRMPTIAPTYGSTVSTSPPTLTGVLTPDPSHYPTTAHIVIYTISIVFHSCEQENEAPACGINQTTITGEVNAVIVAYIDYDTKILSSDIINNEVVMVLSIGMDEYNSSIGERMSDRIENELEDKYGDGIDVTVKETNGEDDTEPSKDNDSWTWSVIISVVIGAVIVAMVYCFRIKRCKRVLVQKQLQQDAKVANDNVSSAVIDEDEQMHNEEDLMESSNVNKKANHDLESMINVLNKVPLTLLVTKSDIETLATNDEILDEIEGEGENTVGMKNEGVVEMGYTHDGTRGAESGDVETKTMIGSNVCIPKQTTWGDAVEDV